MRQFASVSFRLRDAAAPVRSIYAGFLLLTAVGLATQAGFQAGRIGLSPAAIARYYRGGPAGDTMAFPKPWGHLLEITHAHAFTMAVVFLVLGHLFLGTSLGPRAKRVVVLVSFAGIAGDLAGPWLVRYVAAGFAWLQLGAWIALWCGGAVMVGTSLRECLALGPPAALDLPPGGKV
jgi:hypothetical protein